MLFRSYCYNYDYYAHDRRLFFFFFTSQQKPDSNFEGEATFKTLRTEQLYYHPRRLLRSDPPPHAKKLKRG